MSTAALAAEKYNFRSLGTYLAALGFIAGNILVPQLCHLVPNGGLIFLPIYFFTLVGAFKCGWKVGILTAVLSPLVNCVLLGHASGGVPAGNSCKISHSGSGNRRHKPEYESRVKQDISNGVALFGSRPMYWKYVRELALKYWAEWDRALIFDIVMG